MTQKQIQKVEQYPVALKSLTKAEMVEQVENALNKMSGDFYLPELWVIGKKMELIAETWMARIKQAAEKELMEDAAEMKEVLGCEIKVESRKDYDFSPAVEALKAKHKLEMDALKASEKATGMATTTTKQIIKVNIK